MRSPHRPAAIGLTERLIYRVATSAASERLSILPVPRFLPAHPRDFLILAPSTAQTPDAGRMILPTSQLQRFFYSHYFFSGLRQATGVLLPALVLSGLFGLHAQAFVAAV